jgi:hypothetical protein
MSGNPFFTDAKGEHQKSIFHSLLTRHSSLMVKFKQTPFDSQWPRAGTPGKIVYMELDDGFEYIYQIENQKIVTILDQIEPDQWYRISAVGKGEQADMKLVSSDGEPAYEEEERVALQSEPAPVDSSLASTAGPPPTPSSSGNGVMPTHVDCTAMTLETVNAFEGAGTVLESDAIARIYNTHFIALSKQKGGLIR